MPVSSDSPLWLAITGAPKWLWLACTFGNFLFIYFLHKDDDDNWWKRKKKQLKKWVQNMSKKPIAVGAQS